MINTSTCNAPETGSNAEIARAALEQVCNGSGRAPASRYYSPRFVDYVNDMTFHGLAGTQQSVAMYKGVLSNINITVEEQVVEGERVTSRFVVSGENRGRRVRFNGITISRLQDGLIVEDWSVTDTLGMLRQLGLWRIALVGVRQWKTLMAASR